MSDETRNTGDADQRPVDPPVIDLNADEFNRIEEPSEAAEAAAPDADASRKTFHLPVSHYLISAAIACVAAGAIIGIMLVTGLLQTADRDEDNIEQRLAAVETSGSKVNLQTGQLAAAMDELRKSLKAETERLAGFNDSGEAARGEAQQALAAVEDLRATLTRIAEENKAQASEIAQIRDQITGLKSEAAAPSPQAQAPQASAPQTDAGAEADRLASDLIALQTASAEGRPFETELAALAAAMPKSEDIQAAAAFAKQGVPSRTTLLERLKAFVDEGAAAETGGSEEESGLWDTVKKKVGSVVRIRPLEDAAFLDAARGSVGMMENGDLAAAVRNLEQTEGTPPEPLRQWIADASSRLQLDQAVERLSDAVVREISRRT
ncbi:MAG TPA: hypothetical protein VJS40_01300 [Aestuariivirgaceae bacterium]|nr:hypothetical protein [Aestuariivirgaceae bacterium]